MVGEGHRLAGTHPQHQQRRCAPVIFAATQPPAAKLKNAPQMTIATSMPIKPKIKATVSAASAPTQTAFRREEGIRWG
jgi:hypothetical protein